MCNNECRLGKQEHGCLIPLHYVRGKCNNRNERKDLTNCLICLFCFLSAYEYTFRILPTLRSSGSDNPQTVMTFRGGQHVSRRYRKRDVKCFPEGEKCYSSKHMLRITGSDTSAPSAAWIGSDWSAHEFCDMRGLRKGKPQGRSLSCPSPRRRRLEILFLWHDPAMTVSLRLHQAAYPRGTLSSHTECLGTDLLTSVALP